MQVIKSELGQAVTVVFCISPYTRAVAQVKILLWIQLNIFQDAL